ncbi:MAG: WD40/YVTN/BNR-like repeat-containing protein [Gammaproteobacteria bacterium]
MNLDGQFPFHIYGAQQDEGSFEGPSATPDGEVPLSAWHSVAYGESSFVVPQPGNPNITYGSGYYSIFVKYDLATGQYQSVSPWPNYMDGAASDELKYRFAWTHPILFSPVNHKTLYVGSQYVMKSTDYGQTWQTISPDLTRNAASTEGPTGGPVDLDQSGAEIYPNVSALAVSPLDGNIIWAGSSDGRVHVTSDGGKQWQAVRPTGLPKWSRIGAIAPSPATKGTAYLVARRYMWDDFKPYVFETNDYGKHWKAITDGLPDDQYAFDVAVDPNDTKLLFLTTRSTVYASFDGGAHWQPLTLNLPRTQVRGVAINTREGEVVVATHGRAFWILDDLALLEQMTRQPSVNANSAALFAPGRTWLTHAYGRPDYPGAGKGAGENPPFGATIFFHIPKNYAGKTPVTLSFATAGGKAIRRFKLHLRPEKAGKTKAPNSITTTPAEKRVRAERRHTAISPGMNRFQWHLRYPNAAPVKGFYPPEAAGGLAASVEGPQVVPGNYRVTLDYGGKQIGKSFQVSLDPRLHASQADLEASLALQMKIHKRLNAFDKALNRAIAVRDKLEAAHPAKSSQAAKALSALNAAIASLVQLKIHSSEGDLLHETKLRSHLAYLQTDVGMAYARPTTAQRAVFKHLADKTQAGEKKLAAAVIAAKRQL